LNETTGIVTKVFGLYCAVKYSDKHITCVLRGKIRQSDDMKKYSAPVAVGDHVSVTLNDDGSGVIDKILKRKNIFSRKEKGKNKKEDIIAANLDLVVIIQSFKNPRLNLRFVDRLILRSAVDKIHALLCVNKADIAAENISNYIQQYYQKANIDLCFTSTITGEGLQNLAQILSGKTALFIGNSGVGKTSILNYLAPDLNLRISEVSLSTNKGRHTTSNVEMIDFPDNASIIDTPGVREFGLMDIEPHMLGFYFNDFSGFFEKCAFNPCMHDHEPDCEVKRQVDKGVIFQDRYQSYLNILNSLREYHNRKYQ
jgi:ribosome biogenesis GTPase / thiamine phosphate phosphatase